VSKNYQIKVGLIGASFMVCPWFVHGSSMVPPSKTPKSMDKPWRNHGGTMDKPIMKPFGFVVDLFRLTLSEKVCK
jgi:hypothetical protein